MPPIPQFEVDLHLVDCPSCGSANAWNGGACWQCGRAILPTDAPSSTASERRARDRPDLDEALSRWPPLGGRASPSLGDSAKPPPRPRGALISAASAGVAVLLFVDPGSTLRMAPDAPASRDAAAPPAPSRTRTVSGSLVDSAPLPKPLETGSAGPAEPAELAGPDETRARLPVRSASDAMAAFGLAPPARPALSPARQPASSPGAEAAHTAGCAPKAQALGLCPTTENSRKPR